MKIQLNTDKNILGDERFKSHLNTLIKDKFARFSDYITRIEVHLSDENSQRGGEQDKRCLIEARLENKQPVAVSSDAHTIEEAVTDALEKLKTLIGTIDDQMKEH